MHIMSFQYGLHNGGRSIQSNLIFLLLLTVNMKLDAVLIIDASKVVLEACNALLKFWSMKMLLNIKVKPNRI